MSGRETVMFEGTGMTTQPEQPDDLERMFADEEAAISDDGFSSRVMEQAPGGFGWRRTIVYGAGMAGFGASAPAEVLYEKFGITVQAIIARAEALVGLPSPA